MNRAARRAKQHAWELAQALKHEPDVFVLSPGLSDKSHSVHMEIEKLKNEVAKRMLDAANLAPHCVWYGSAQDPATWTVRDEAEKLAEALTYEPEVNSFVDALKYGTGVAMGSEVGSVEVELAHALTYEPGLTRERLSGMVEMLKAHAIIKPPEQKMLFVLPRKCAKTYIAELLSALGVPATKHGDRVAFANGSEVHFV